MAGAFEGGPVGQIEGPALELPEQADGCGAVGAGVGVAGGYRVLVDLNRVPGEGVVCR